MKVFDAELFATKQAMELAGNGVTFQTEDIWIYSDSQATIRRLSKTNMTAGQVYVRDIQTLAESINMNINIHIH
jgi:ribonuclease HI